MEKRIRVIDSHTGGEPTRVVIDGLPPVAAGSAREISERMAKEWDHYRTAIVGEPRSSDIVVGAYVFPSSRAGVQAKLVFFNNVGYLGMCGHGTIGVVTTLAWLGHIRAGVHVFETPVGDVSATLHADGRVTVANVPSFRYQKAVPVDVPGFGRVHGDIAWGGNWFFLCDDHGLTLAHDNIAALQDFSVQLSEALHAQNIRGQNQEVIDHIELFGESETADSRNYVLCPGLAYDRSPCGTGTSAKIACLAADEKLAPNVIWKQESIIGSIFEACYQRDGERVLPLITGVAFVNADAVLILNDKDPYQWGIEQAERGNKPPALNSSSCALVG